MKKKIMNMMMTRVKNKSNIIKQKRTWRRRPKRNEEKGKRIERILRRRQRRRKRKINAIGEKGNIELLKNVRTTGGYKERRVWRGRGDGGGGGRKV